MIKSYNKPKYIEISDILTDRIFNKQIVPQDPFPTIRNIAKEFDVSINTADRAVAVLVEQGILITRGKKGIKIADIPEQKSIYRSRLLDSISGRLPDIYGFAVPYVYKNIIEHEAAESGILCCLPFESALFMRMYLDENGDILKESLALIKSAALKGVLVPASASENAIHELSSRGVKIIGFSDIKYAEIFSSCSAVVFNPVQYFKMFLSFVLNNSSAYSRSDSFTASWEKTYFIQFGSEKTKVRSQEALDAALNGTGKINAEIRTIGPVNQRYRENLFLALADIGRDNLICVNDQILVQPVYEFLSKRSLVPGKDIGVVGAGTAGYAESFFPPLTTLGFDIRKTGEVFFSLVKEKNNRHVEMPFVYFQRKSSHSSG